LDVCDPKGQEKICDISMQSLPALVAAFDKYSGLWKRSGDIEHNV
jgi:hypothetical protein